MQRYWCGGARTLAEVCESWGLVQYAYEQLGYAQPSNGGLRFALRDFLPSSRLFVTYELRRLVATFTVVEGEEVPFPSESVFPEQVRELRSRPGKMLEGTKFATVEDTLESQKAVLVTLAQLFAWAYVRGAERIIITVNPHHVGFWKRKFGFEVVASTEACSYVGSAPGVLLCAQVKQHIVRCGGCLDLTDKNPGYGPIFTAARIAQLITSEGSVLEKASEQEKRVLYKYYPELEGLAPLMLGDNTLKNEDEINLSAVRGSGIQELVNDIFTALRCRLERSRVYAKFDTHEINSRYELRDTLQFLVAFQTLLDCFFQFSPKGAEVWGTLKLAISQNQAALFVFVREDTRSIPLKERKEYLRRIHNRNGSSIRQFITGQRILGDMGGYVVTESESSSRYFALLLPLSEATSNAEVTRHDRLRSSFDALSAHANEAILQAQTEIKNLAIPLSTELHKQFAVDQRRDEI